MTFIYPDTPEQRHIDALNHYVRLNELYLRRLSPEDGVIARSTDEIFQIGDLADAVEQAEREYYRTFCEVMQAKGRWLDPYRNAPV